MVQWLMFPQEEKKQRSSAGAEHMGQIYITLKNKYKFLFLLNLKSQTVNISMAHQTSI